MEKILFKIAFLASVLFIMVSFSSCEKQYEKKTVTYQITKSVSGFNVNYRNELQELIKEKIVTNSAEDKWTYSFKAKPRDIVFVSANYKDISSAIDIKILIDGKVYKQASTKFDTTMFVTVSGTIPE